MTPVQRVAADLTRSEAGGWSGYGSPEHGDYVRPRPAGNAHIVRRTYPTLSGSSVIVETVCGKDWTNLHLAPAPEDPDRPCARCWELM